MWVISKRRLKLFGEPHGRQDSEGPLLAWYSHVNSKTVSWHSWGDVKADYGNASTVGHCAVFNIGGNKYRLVTRILYRIQKVFILKVMTHKEYDDGKWKEECGCFTPPPEIKAAGSILRKQKRKRR